MFARVSLTSTTRESSRVNEYRSAVPFSVTSTRVTFNSEGSWFWANHCPFPSFPAGLPSPAYAATPSLITLSHSLGHASHSEPPTPRRLALLVHGYLPLRAPKGHAVGAVCSSTSLRGPSGVSPLQRAQRDVLEHRAWPITPYASTPRFLRHPRILVSALTRFLASRSTRWSVLYLL